MELNNLETVATGRDLPREVREEARTQNQLWNGGEEME